MSVPTIQQTFDAAERHRIAGQSGDAEKLYRQIIAEDAKHAPALHMLGVVLFDSGRGAESLEPFRRAAALEPTRSDYLYNLGQALSTLGQRDEAIAVFRSLVALYPQMAQAHRGLADALFLSGRAQESVEIYRKALALRPDDAAIASNLGYALHVTGKIDEAIAVYRAAIAARSNVPQLHYNLGVSLTALDQTDAAIDAYRASLALAPDSADACNNLGAALQKRGDLDEALAVFQRLQSLRPNSAHVYNNIGGVLQLKGRTDHAVAEHRRAVALDPSMPEAHYNLALSLRWQRQFYEAIAEYKRTLELAPTHADAHNNLGNVLKDLGDLPGAIKEYRAALALRADYTDADSNAVLAMMYCEEYTAPDILREMKAWEQRHAAKFAAAILPLRNDRNPNRRLRVGYVSPDFREHVVGRNVLPILQRHDHANFEIFCYANHAHPDDFTRQFRESADGWRDISRAEDDAIAQMIRNDGIDILIDLAGHTSHNRLLVFARKPAPIQATWGGYPGGTGLSAMDYRISDLYLDPVGQTDSFYTEKIFRLPDSFWCYDPIAMGVADLPVSPLPASSAGFVTFGCLNNFCKMTPSSLALWLRVLQKVPQSRLILLSPEGEHRQKVLKQLAVDPARVEFISHKPRREYLRIYDRIDLGLDTLPYNGHTTSLDALWMGVPVVTRFGDSAPSRAGFSQLSNLKLTELAAESDERFVRIAVELAGDLPRMAQTRAGLRERMLQSPLTDAVRFTRNLEAAYRKMWTDWIAKGPTP
jgi:predicted O-linked N-acetylglucosamine transferase (SPINDLY family)